MPAPVWYVPAWQSRQMLAKLAPLAVEYDPAEHAVQDALVCKLVPVKYVPAEHCWQVLAIVAPRAVLYRPAEHA